MKTKLVVGVFAVCSLIGCSKPDPTAASKENFEKAINEYLSKDTTYCSPLAGAYNNDSYEDLMAHGLITKSNKPYKGGCPKDDKNIFECDSEFRGGHSEYFPYFLTDKAKQIEPKDHRICYATPKLLKIIRWTAGNSSPNGAIVEFEIEPDKVASWVGEFPAVKEKLSKPIEFNKIFIQSNDGWHSDLLF